MHVNKSINAATGITGVPMAEVDVKQSGIVTMRLVVPNENSSYAREKGQDKIASHISKNIFDKQFKLQTIKWMNFLNKNVQAPRMDSQGICAPEDAKVYFEVGSEVLLKELIKQSSGYSPYKWLWYLRRCPVYFYDVDHRGFFVTLVEGVTSIITEREEVYQAEYPINSSVIKRIISLCAGALILDKFISFIEQADGGVFFRMQGIQIKSMLRKEESAWLLYDDRRQKHKESFEFLLSQGGSVLGGVDNNYEDENVDGFIVVRYDLPRTEYFSVANTRVQNDRIYMDVNYKLHPIKFYTEPRFFQGLKTEISDYWNKEIKLLRCLLTCLNITLAQLTEEEKEHIRISILNVGYFLVLQQCLNEAINEALKGDAFRYFRHLMSFESFIEELQIIGESWKILKVGSPIRKCGPFYCIDIFALGEILKTVSAFPKGNGPIAQARGQHFENITQEVINKSKWVPNDELLQIRNLQLKLNGKEITDIDAIGEKDGKLLLVSCKSRIVDSEYMMGHSYELMAIKNRITLNVEKWNEKVEIIIQNPKGDNYDFSKYNEIYGIVCYPFPQYVDIGVCTRKVFPELNVFCIISELKRFVDQ